MPMQGDFQSRYGPWAIVTGASSGIGREFVLQLADRGMNLVLVARRKSLLDALDQSLTEARGIKTKIVAADLNLPEAPQRLADATSDLEIGCLSATRERRYTDRSSIRIPTWVSD